MPVRLDPFQNIIGVNWGGGRLAPVCQIFVRYENLGQNPWMLTAQIVTPEVLGPIGGIADFDSVSGLIQYIDGQFYSAHSVITRDGFANDPREAAFRSLWIRPVEFTGGIPEIVEVRLLGRSTDASLPTVAAVIGTFGFGLELFQPGELIEKMPDGLIWTHYPLEIPLPNTFETTNVRADRERRFEIWGNRAFIRVVEGLDRVADFGTLRLNFRTGNAEMLPPDTTPPPPIT